MKTSIIDKLNSPTGAQVASWLQASLFTRSADSYFNPLIQSVVPGAGLSRQYQQAKVLEIQKHHANAATLRIQTPRSWQGFVPGQYISCEFTIDGVRRKRNYSVSSPQALFEKNGQITITVHRVEGGLVSNHILDSLRLGSLFSISEAMGGFGLELSKTVNNKTSSTRPLILLAAGSGITPFASILTSLVSSEQMQNRDIHLFYSCSKKAEHLFQKTFSALEKNHPRLHLHWHSTRDNSQKKDSAKNNKRIDADLLGKHCSKINKAELYICGSNDFTHSMIAIAQTLGINKKHIHFESFDSSFKAAINSEGHVHFSRSNKSLRVNDNSSLLEQAELSGLNPKSGCRMGVCHSCTCTKTSGIVINRLTGEQSSPDEEDIRLCISQALGEVKIAL